MAKSQDRSPVHSPNFRIVTPSQNGNVGTDFTVLGTCDELATVPGLTITVRLTRTISGGSTETLQMDAMADTGNCTWEAYFCGVPENTIWTIEASNTVPDNANPIGNVNVQSSEFTGTDVQEPVNNEIFNDLTTPVPAIASAALALPSVLGSHRLAHVVHVYATLKGNKFAPQLVQAGTHTGGAHPVKWERHLADLVPNINHAGKRFLLHLSIQIPGVGQPIHVTRGVFQARN